MCRGAGAQSWNPASLQPILFGSMPQVYPTKVPWWSLWSFVALSVAVVGFALLSEHAGEGFPNWVRDPFVFAVLAVPAVLFWFVSLSLLISTSMVLRSWRPLDEIPGHVELTDIPDAFASMGFLREPVVLQAHGAVLICYPDSTYRTWATLIVTQQRQLVLDYVSFLHEGFNLCTQQLRVRLPGFERNLTQAFPDLYPDQLLSQHEEGLSWLAERGLQARSVIPAALGEELQRVHRAGAFALARRLLRSTVVYVSRWLKRKGPHERPIGQQPGVSRVLGQVGNQVRLG